MERILIADDEALMRQLVADFLRPEGYEVLEAVDGKQALDIFNEQKPDLVLLDVMMPGYDGWTVCREIRRTSTVPIIMITAKDEEIDQLFAYDLGVDDYITKPFSPKLLVAKMKALLRRLHGEGEE
ncbi:MAG: response regulator, partial [Megasphaera micronuciformis]|nr:response regulator [Megasphaera micronuciformis]